ncbi:FAD-binding oxidoreductase [Sulfitobacter sp. W074]|nr:FAD-binding oxidoreductase [Sulfitobacter sp. W074]
MNRIATAASACGVAITARGGGTGTNGQSLTGEVCIECSRYLTKIEAINVTEGYAIVQPGVILDQLNRAAGAHGLFFAPTVSTASRATLGGMAATDASGKGSRVYGRTSDHVLEMDVVLADGRNLNTSVSGQLGTDVTAVLTPEKEEIKRIFPAMNRGLTGYNLQDALLRDDGFVKLLCGSEGTLALTKRLKVRLLPKPAVRALAVFAYGDMMAALRDVRRLVQAYPDAIEFIDDKILFLAQQDPVWDSVSRVLEDQGGNSVQGLNFVEISGDTKAEVDSTLERLHALGNAPVELVHCRVVTDPAIIAELWQVRSKCVGLLGRMDTTRQGTAFVEDAAVPPERLPDFVEGFRSILDCEGLQYGMFGHADVGCVHVRPALDMRLPGDAAIIRRVSDQVNALALAHGGLIWGEHGKGFRGEYGREVFGPRLYGVMCQIKAMFDPEGLLNPGKIAVPNRHQALTALDEVPFRGPLDAQISPVLSQDYSGAIKCNGNGQCMGQDFDEAMCPSYKATGDRTRSPKGRAAMLRQWSRLQSQGAPSHDLSALEATLHDSLSDCLGCKACASQCPIKVDIPQMRSRFYASYYARHRRPLLHHLLTILESIGPILRMMPMAANLGMSVGAPVLRRLGLVDLPNVRPLRNSPGSTGKIVLIADSFLATFDGQVLDAAKDVLKIYGCDVSVSEPMATGKPAHVVGVTAAFERAASKTLRRLHDFAEGGAQLVAIEPSFLSMFSNEYADLGLDVPNVTSLDRLLLEVGSGTCDDFDAVEFTLFNHCTEISADPKVGARWKEIFRRHGLRLGATKTGCCGMAGTFGHEAAKVEMSKALFDMSWKAKIAAAKGPVLATGFSCRCQVKRFSGKSIVHPIEALRAALVSRS